MKFKKMTAAMLAAIIAAGSFAASTVGAGNVVSASAQQSTLSAPENLRYEGGNIKWDEAANAYGYILCVSDGENTWEHEHNFTNEEDLFVEFDRFCYEKSLPLGTYTVKMCTFNASRVRSEWTDSITVEYAAALSAPGNLRLSEDAEETVLWDAVDGAYRYNIRITNSDGEGVLSDYISGTSYNYNWSWGETGTYSFSVQAMDKDYNVSEWRSLSVTHTYTEVERVHLDAPQNVRFDESGENILWDAVDGADYYRVDVDMYAADENGNDFWHYGYGYPTETHFDNWKSVTAAFPNAGYQIYVYACKNDVAYDNESSEVLEATSTVEQDTTIEMPDSIQADGQNLKWSAVDNADTYWVSVLANGKFPAYSGSCTSTVKAEDYSEDTGYYVGVLNYLPEGTYDVELYVIDKDGGYNKKTYSMTLGSAPDESVWVPNAYSKDNIVWDYDRIRHDNTEGFWVRVKDADDGTLVKLESTSGGYYYGFWDLSDGNYTVEVCAYEYGQIDEDNYGYKVGPWSDSRNVDKHGDSGFDEENEKTTDVEFSADADGVLDGDKINSITINPAFNMKDKYGADLDLSKINLKAEAIYNKNDLKKAEEALGNTIKGNKHYNLLDLTLLYNGEDFSNGYDGLVKVIIPLPAGHKNKEFSCYRLTEVDGKLVKEVIPGEQTDDSYIIYLEHFSLYALVADANPDDGEGSEPTSTPDDNNSQTTNPGTGIALTAVPVVITAAAAILAVRKKRK